MDQRAVVSYGLLKAHLTPRHTSQDTPVFIKQQNMTEQWTLWLYFQQLVRHQAAHRAPWGRQRWSPEQSFPRMPMWTQSEVQKIHVHSSIQSGSCHNNTFCLHLETEAQGSCVLCSQTIKNLHPQVATDIFSAHCLTCRQNASLCFNLLQFISFRWRFWACFATIQSWLQQAGSPAHTSVTREPSEPTGACEEPLAKGYSCSIHFQPHRLK